MTIQAEISPSRGKRKRRPRSTSQKQSRQAPLSILEKLRVEAAMRTIACSEAWIDSVIEELLERKRISYTTDEHGSLKTEISELLVSISMAGIYPPAADDKAKYEGRGDRAREIHIGSAMKPCFTHACTRRRTDDTRAILYPANYVGTSSRSHGTCYTCYVNGSRLVETAEELGLDPVTFQSSSAEGVKQVGDGRWEENAWRNVSSASLVNDPAIIIAINEHRWSCFSDRSNKLHKRGLKTLGAMNDFLEYGHRMIEVAGLSFDAAELLEKLVREYPRQGAWVPVKIVERRTSQREFPRLK